MLTNWIKEFTNRNNRPPKILHIGNIANNAYQNAKALNNADADCDVLAYDYYHVAGCPEWDDADFVGEIKDQFYPNWHKVDLNGFERPKWFAQGLGSFCLRYLLAKRKNKESSATFWWKMLELQSRAMSLNSTSASNTIKLVSFLKIFLIQLYQNIIHYISYIIGVFIMMFTNFKLFCSKIKLLIKGKLWSKEGIDKNEDIIEVRKKFNKLFPDRKAKFSSVTLGYISSAKLYKKLFDCYDIIIGYADTPILPYLAGVKNYIAFEHGSIRDLPYEDNDRGRLMLMAYANAKAVYVTNIDCVDSAKYITKNTDAKIIYGLHGIDIDRITQKIRNSKVSDDFDFRFGAKAKEKVFFCPARHDIDKERGVFLKGNEKIVAAAGKLSNEFDNFKLVFVEFGNDVSIIKELINKHPNLEKHIVWVDILSKAKLYQTYLNVDAVLDQFLLKAFGAITVETLCAGGGVLISQKVPDEEMKMFFGEQLPSFKCDDENDIYEAMKTVMTDENECRERAQKGAQWINKYHSSKRIVNLLEDAFSFCEN